MPQTGLGVALKTLRERNGMSLREIGQRSSTDHAYIHRLETGEKTSPSSELVARLLAVLRPSERDAGIVYWLMDHPEADVNLVDHAMQDGDVSLEVFSAAAGMKHRGTVRPDPATLISRVRRAFEDDDEDG